MCSYGMIMKFQKEHSEEIRLLDMAFLGALMTLVYTAFNSSIIRQDPAEEVRLFPCMQNLCAEIEYDSQMMRQISESLVEGICSSERFQQQASLPEFSIFKCSDMVKILFDLRSLPQAIQRTTNHLAMNIAEKYRDWKRFNESDKIDIFYGLDITDRVEYLINETVLQMLMIAQHVRKETLLMQRSDDITFPEDGILSITTQEIPVPILISHEIVDNTILMNRILHVTGTSMVDLPVYTNDADNLMIMNRPVNRIFTTYPFNDSSITVLHHPDPAVDPEVVCTHDPNPPVGKYMEDPN